ncbi:MAG: hypothetical protein ACE10A_02410 [Acidiferrobacterales bacterium]
MAKADNSPGIGPGPTMRARGLMAVACLTVLYASPAHAYLDPGTGSIILQGLLAGIAAAMAAAGLYWARVKNFFSSVFSSKKLADSNPEQDPEN